MRNADRLQVWYGSNLGLRAAGPGTLVKEVAEKRAGNRSSLPTFVYSSKSYLVLSSPSIELFHVYGVFSLF